MATCRNPALEKRGETAELAVRREFGDTRRSGPRML